MFKKNEESEWTRFSRALGGAQPTAPTDEDGPADTQSLPADDYDSRDDSQDAVTLAQLPPVATEPQTYTPPPAPPAYEPDEPSETPSFITHAPPTVAAPAFVSTPAPAPASLAPAASADETVIGDGASIEGNVRSDKSIRVRGAVQGEIESKQQVIVEESAKVSARIVAEHVTVLGEVDGSIECSGRLEIASSARVTGEVTSSTLVIQEGAFFEGNLKMSASRENA